MSSAASSTIRLKTGDQYSLTLKGRLTAGYQWVFSSDPDDIISIEKKVKPKKRNEASRAGSSADEEFLIVGRQKGTATLHLKQLRIWETGSKPIEERTISVIVQ